MSTLSEIISATDAKRVGGGWMGRCPVHGDKKASLSIKDGDKGVVLHCHVCGEEKKQEIVKTLGYSISDLFHGPKGSTYSAKKEEYKIFPSANAAKKELEHFKGNNGGSWVYSDKGRKPLCLILRFDKENGGKDFRPISINGDGWSIKGMDGQRPLYNLPEIVERPNEPIFVVEGEKAADAGGDIGILSTTSMMGGGAAKATDWTPIKGRTVYILPDNDDKGKQYAADVAEIIGKRNEVYIVDLELDEPKEDLFEFVNKYNRTKDDLLAICDKAEEQALPKRSDGEREWQNEIIPGGNATYHLGEECGKEVIKDKEPVYIPWGRNVWPDCLFEKVETGEVGIRYRYLDNKNRERFGLMKRGATVEKNTGKKACVEAADNGVFLLPNSDNDLASALGSWASNEDREVISIVSTPGWHGKAYVNGMSIFGENEWEANEQAIPILHRSRRSGTSQEWSDKVNPLIKTPGLLAALSVSLAGPLVQWAGTGNFGVHFCGMSSSGKSTVAKLAASIWGDMRSMFSTWNTTTKALEGIAEKANGACLILDDISKIDGSTVEKRGDNLGKAIHSICSDNGRARLKSSAELQSQRYWKTTVLSTGEMKTRTMIGDSYQGGHRVRMIDLWDEQQNSFTVDAEHAEEIEAVTETLYGSISDRWVEQLTALDMSLIQGRMDDWRQRLKSDKDSKEDGRIQKHLSVILVAADMTIEAGVISVPRGKVQEMAEWLLSCVRDEGVDDKKTPEERAYKTLRNMMNTQPHRFPDEFDFAKGRDVVGVRCGDDGSMKILTTKGMLEASGLAAKSAISIHSWIKWLKNNGYAEPESMRKQVNGFQATWIVVNVK